MGQQGVLRTVEGGNLMFWCPGCEEHHAVNIRDPGKPQWGWNGDFEKPTFSPSILIRSGHYLPEHPIGKPCWCTYNAKHPEQKPVFTCDVCHSFVTAGNIQFLPDCTHALAGQTVPLTAEPTDGG